MKNKTIILTLFLLLMRIAFAFEIVEEAVAYINDDIITKSEFSKRFKDYKKQMSLLKTPIKKSGIDKAKRDLMDDLISEYLIIQEARRQDISVNEEEVNNQIKEMKKMNGIPDDATFKIVLKQQGMSLQQLKENIRRQQLVMKVKYTVIRNEVSEPTTEEMKTYYEKNKGKMFQPDQYQIAQILIKVKPNLDFNSQKKLRKKAESILEKVLNGGNFAKLAKRYSDDTLTKDNGGDMGLFEKEQIRPEFLETILKMKVGDYSSLIRTGLGYHIIKLEDFIPGRILTYNEVKDKIKSLLYEQKMNEAFKDWIDRKKQVSAIKIKHDRL